MRCSPTRWGCCVARRGSLEGGTVQLCDRFHPLLAAFLLCIYSLSPPSLPSLPHRLCTNSGPFLFFVVNLPAVHAHPDLSVCPFFRKLYRPGPGSTLSMRLGMAVTKSGHRLHMSKATKKET